MSDLSAIFPDLPADILRDFDAPGGRDGGLTADGERGQVTDDDIAAYLYQIGSLRAPLSPLVENQQAPPNPEFATNGRTAPPANQATVEAPDYGDGLTPPPPQGELENPPLTTPPAVAPQRPPDTAPPVNPAPDPGVGFPQPGDVPTPTGVPDEAPIPPSPSLPVPPPVAPSDPNAQLAAIVQNDPQLRELIARYYLGQVAAPPAVPTPPPVVPQYYSPPVPPAVPQAPPLAAPQPAGQPQFQFDEYTDPNVRALVEQNTRIQQQLEQVTNAQRFASERETQVQMRHFTQVVEGAVSQWGEHYQVPPNVLQDVRQVAARMGAAQTYMNGVHPITGAPVVPDPSEATKVALDIAFHSTPSAVQMEQDRTRQRYAADNLRRQRLGGVGGSSASVPRQQPAPTDAAGRRAAMNQEVAEMMRGEWSGSSSN